MYSWPILATLIEVVLIDISLAGDNAVAVGTAAASLSKTDRHRAVLAGVAAATVLRLIFAVVAVQMLHTIGVLLAGGLLLLWVAWKMHRDLLRARHKTGAGQGAPKTFRKAIIQIIIADVSMSLDNVLAVASVARDHLWTLAAGLGLSVILMGLAATYVATLIERMPWLGYVGAAIVFYTAIGMVWQGAGQVAGF